MKPMVAENINKSFTTQSFLPIEKRLFVFLPATIHSSPRLHQIDRLREDLNVSQVTFCSQSHLVYRKMAIYSPGAYLFRPVSDVWRLKEDSAKKREALNFQWQYRELRLLERNATHLSNVWKETRKEENAKMKFNQTGAEKEKALINFKHALTTGGK